MSNYNNKSKNTDTLFYSATIGTVVAVGAWLMTRYKVCQPNQQLVKTGLAIKDMAIAKKSIIFPFQKFQFIDMNPKTFSFHLHHMSREKVPFNLPVVFTVSPYDPNENVDLFKNYARTMTNADDENMSNTIKGVIHGESRVLAADLSVEELFRDREKFKHTVSDKIQMILNQYGLKINNANIEEIQDLPGSEIFKFLRLKATEGINNASRVDVAEAKKIGDCGQEEREAYAKQQIAQYHATTISVQNERELEIAESVKNLEVRKAEYKQLVEIARLNADKAKEIREAELQRDVEIKRIEQEKEAIRAKQLVLAQVEAEAAIARASGEAEAKKRLADAELYAQQKRADAIQANLNAEAQGLKAKLLAESEGMQELLNACGGNTNLLQYNLAIRSGLFEKIAAENAKAIQGLQPKYNIWSNDVGINDPITKIIKSLPPIMDVVNQQTNIDFGSLLKPSSNQKV
jgi:flotillin